MRCLLLVACLSCFAQDPFATQACLAEADAAVKAGSPDEARKLLVGGLTRDPAHTRLLARLLRLDRKAGREAEARIWASRLLDLGVDPGDEAATGDLRPRAEALRRSEGQAEVAAVLPGGGRLIEGIAQDPRSGDLLLASVNQGMILRRTPKGRVTTFATLSGWTPLALAVDARHQLLWAAGGVLELMERADPKSPRRAVAAAFDLRSGRRIREVSLEATAERPRLFGDLLVKADGTLLLSDGSCGGLWRLRPGATALDPFVPEGKLLSPQGMAWLEDGSFLLADYALGLFRVDAAGGLHPLAAPAGACLLGVDGLAAWKGAVYATQNGVAPARLWRLEVKGDRVMATTRLRAHPAFGEPTLLTATRGGLLLVANAQWDRFGPGGVQTRPTEPVILLRLR